MEIDFLDFVEQCRRLAKRALEKHVDRPTGDGFARWVYVVLRCFWLKEGHSYRGTLNRLKYTAKARDTPGLDRDELSDYSTIYKSFDRLKMWIWRALLRISTQQHPQSGHAAPDNTFFDRHRASPYSRQRSGSTIQTLKVTTLTDVESLAVSDAHITARWEYDMKTGLQVVCRNTDDLQLVAADNGFQGWRIEYEIAVYDIEYPVRYRGSSPRAALNNAPNRANGYSQRWIAETSHSTAKRSLGDAVRVLGWYWQFRGIVLMFATINIESLCEPL